MNALGKLPLLLLCLVLLTGCACQLTPSPAPSASPSSASSPAPGGQGLVRLPEGLRLGLDGAPLVDVFVVENQAVEQMDMESYLAGVLAGEMQGDWPLEALKAQALLARTFALRFLLDQGGSKYEGADLSTDIEEAQAYNAEGVNDNILAAIEQTRGLVIVDEEGLPIKAWFHAHSGGQTATAKEGLGYEKAEPAYICSVPVDESPEAPAEAQAWSARFDLEEVSEALASLGGGDASALAIEQTGPSGRVTRFSAGDNSVSGPGLRLALGGTRMRSTLLTELRVEDGFVYMAGKGYGHGVGMSQWGAYALAKEGKSAEEIVEAFFQDVRVVSAWPAA